MKRILAFLIILIGFILYSPPVSAEYFTDQEGSDITSYSYEDANKQVVLSATWNVVGNECNVYIIGGNSAGIVVSRSCRAGFLFEGIIKGLDNSGQQVIAKGGSYRIVVGSDHFPPEKKFFVIQTAAGATYATPPTPAAPTKTAPPRPAPIFPADRNVPDAVKGVFGLIQPPEFIDKIGFGQYGISKVLSILVDLIYVIAGIVFLFMIVISAFQWITSGGDKEAVGAARKRLTHAIIGIALMALAGVIITVLGKIIGFGFYLP